MKFYELISRMTTNKKLTFVNLIFSLDIKSRNIFNISESIKYFIKEDYKGVK